MRDYGCAEICGFCNSPDSEFFKPVFQQYVSGDPDDLPTALIMIYYTRQIATIYQFRTRGGLFDQQRHDNCAYFMGRVSIPSGFWMNFNIGIRGSINSQGVALHQKTSRRSNI